MGIKYLIKMKFTHLIAVAALVAGTSAVTVEKTGDWFVDKTPPPTAAGTPSSGFFGADEDDVMNNIFNHYAIPITNAAGQATGTKVLQKDGCQKACAEILLVTNRCPRLRWRPTWLSSSQEHGPNSTLTTLEKSTSLSPTPS